MNGICAGGAAPQKEQVADKPANPFMKLAAKAPKGKGGKKK